MLFKYCKYYKMIVETGVAMDILLKSFVGSLENCKNGRLIMSSDI